jgi:molybdopterin-guanine dinucleotide biosynthesis protein A
MGRPKAWLPLGDRTMLETVIAAVAAGLRLAGAQSGPDAGAPPIVVVAAPGQELPPLPAGVDRAEDAVEGEGPLRGMQAGFAAIAGRADIVYVASCDAPLVRPEFVAWMIGCLGDHDIAVPYVGDRHHPLAAVYRTRVADAIGELLAAGRRRPFDLFERARTRLVTADELRAVDPGLDSLRNFNSPAEYEALVARPGAVTITFEFFGLARRRSGRDTLQVAARTVGEALAALEKACPGLSGSVVEAGRLSPHYRLSINAREFVTDAGRVLVDGDRLIVLSAESGG